jgi:hypothetical protein
MVQFNIDIFNVKIDESYQFDGHHCTDVIDNQETERPVEESISFPKIIHGKEKDQQEKTGQA